MGNCLLLVIPWEESYCMSWFQSVDLEELSQSWQQLLLWLHQLTTQHPIPHSSCYCLLQIQLRFCAFLLFH
uniref:Uncharacterized protein n=1 Tax=Arundo donax TaxID=35708 RepID=A0A0A9CK33_ARUDO